MDETIKRIDFLIKMAVEQGIEVEPFGSKVYTLTDEENEDEDEGPGFFAELSPITNEDIRRVDSLLENWK